MLLGRPNTGHSDVPALGFRRVYAVRVRAGRTPVRFEIDGVVHRRTVTLPVTAAMAASYAAAGYPVLIDDGVAEPVGC